MRSTGGGLGARGPGLVCGAHGGKEAAGAQAVADELHTVQLERPQLLVCLGEFWKMLAAGKGLNKAPTTVTSSHRIAYNERATSQQK